MKQGDKCIYKSIFVHRIFGYVFYDVVFETHFALNAGGIYGGGRRCQDRMVVGSTTICAISAYHH